MNPETQASQLAEWLEAHPGQAPPEGLDSEVVEAVYALRPDLAPAPRVSLDDILAGVTTGPFAGTGSSGGESGPAGGGELSPPVLDEPATAQVIDFAAARQRRRRIWAGVGTFAAAALVLFTVLPQQDELTTSTVATPEQQADKAREPAPPAEPPPAPAAAPAPEAEPGLLDALSSRDFSNEAKSERWDVKPPAEQSAPQPSAPAPAADAGAAPLTEGVTGSSYGAQAPAAPAQEEPAYRYEAEEAPQAAAPTSMGEVEVVSESARQQRRPGRLRGSSEPAVAELDMDDEAEWTAPSVPSDIEGLRASAAPRDYSSGWYLRALEGEEYDRFEAAVSAASGQAPAQASATCSALITDSNPAIGQDMATRAASFSVAAGDLAGALRLVRQGQARSAANTPFRANLFYLEGQILERMGDAEGARAAYTTATNLNLAR